jgi:hypothetical protein
MKLQQSLSIKKALINYLTVFKIAIFKITRSYINFVCMIYNTLHTMLENIGVDWGGKYSIYKIEYEKNTMYYYVETFGQDNVDSTKGQFIVKAALWLTAFLILSTVLILSKLYVMATLPLVYVFITILSICAIFSILKIINIKT